MLSQHDEAWYSDPEQPWGGSRKKRERDPDEERDRWIEAQIEDERERGAA